MANSLGAETLGRDEDMAREMRRGGTWRKAVFEVPRGTSPDLVQFRADKYMLRFGKMLEEKDGCTVVVMTLPRHDPVPYPAVPADRDRYAIYAFVRRRPTLVHYEIPDELVPVALKHGLKLAE